MTMTVPAVPQLPAGYVAQAADLNNLASVATFLLGKPYAHIADQTGGTAIPTVANTISLVGVTGGLINNGTSGCTDTDGMWNAINPFCLQVATPGYYMCRYGLRVVNTSANWVTAWWQFGFGSNNPMAQAFNIPQGMWRNQTHFNGTSSNTLTGGGLSPFPLYPGDLIQLFAQADTGVCATAISGTENSFLEAEWVSSV